MSVITWDANGFHTGGLEGCASTIGATVVTTPAPWTPKQTYRAKIDNVGIGAGLTSQSKAVGSDWVTFVFYMRFESQTGSANFAKAFDGVNSHLKLRRNSNNSMSLYDSNGMLIGVSVAGLLADDTDYFFSVKFKKNNAAAIQVEVGEAGSSRAVIFDLTGEDLDTGGANVACQLLNGSSAAFATNFYVTSYLCRTDNGANIDTNITTEPNGVTFPGGYESTNQFTTMDFGDSIFPTVLSSMFDIPVSTPAGSYVTTAIDLEGGVTMDHPALGGPSGDSRIDGTIVGSIYTWTYRTSGRQNNSQFQPKHGWQSVGLEETDNTTTGATYATANNWNSLTIIESESDLPATPETKLLQMGFKSSRRSLDGSVDVKLMTVCLIHSEYGPVELSDSSDLVILTKDAIQTSGNLFIDGHEPSTSSSNLFIRGLNTFQTSGDMYLKGHEALAASGDLVILGNQKVFSATDLYVNGLNTTSDSADLFTQGTATTSSSSDLVINGHEQLNESFGLFLNGFNATLVIAELFVEGRQSVSNSGDLVISAHEISTDSASLFVAGQNRIQTSGDLFIAGTITSSGDIDHFIRGKDTESNTADLFVQGFLAGSQFDNADLFINGIDNTNTSENLFIQGLESTILSTNLFVGGIGEQSGVVAPTLFIAGKNDTTIFSDLFTKGVGQSTNAATLFILGLNIITDTVDLLILGKNSVFGSNDLLIPGKNSSQLSGSMYISGPIELSSQIDLFLAGAINVEALNSSFVLFINGVESKSPLVCPVLDPAASIQIKDSLIAVYQSRIDALINQLGKNVQLEFDPIRGPCPNCTFDNYRQRSTGIYIPGGPRPFVRGKQCPWCKGRGFEETSVTKCIKCLIKWNPKDVENFGISIADKKSVVRFKTFLTEADDLIRAKTAITNRDIEDQLKLRVRLIQGPIPAGLRELRYCISFWELM